MKLGDLLAQAGVKGAKKSSFTVEEARALSKATKSPEPIHSQEAMKNLPAEFDKLRQITKGKEFIEELFTVVSRHLSAATNGGSTFEFSEHVVHGLVQLVHFHRDRLTGSKRASYSKLVPEFLTIREKLLKQKPINVAMFLKELTDIRGY